MYFLLYLQDNFKKLFMILLTGKEYRCQLFLQNTLSLVPDNVSFVLSHNPGLWKSF